MIDPRKLVLAQGFFQLKQGNQPLYSAIGKALSDMADPEMKGLLSVPRDTLEVQQGRARMITEVLEVFFRCEEMCRPPPRASAPAGKWTPGKTMGDILNGS